MSTAARSQSERGEERSEPRSHDRTGEFRDGVYAVRRGRERAGADRPHALPDDFEFRSAQYWTEYAASRGPMTLFGFTPVELGVVAFATGSAALGLYVAALAYRGMTRHDSGPMWYLSVGLFVLTGVTYGTAFVGTVLIRLRVLPLPAQDPFRLVVRILQFVGLAFIAYSLHSRELPGPGRRHRGVLTRGVPGRAVAPSTR